MTRVEQNITKISKYYFEDENYGKKKRKERINIKDLLQYDRIL